MTMLLKNIFVGLPKTVGEKDASDPMDREWESGIFKQPVDGAVWLGKTNLTGDGQADLKHHGGPEKAVFAYPAEHYHYWHNNEKTAQIMAGGMGENFLTETMTEDSVCIGDTFRIGEAVIQVSQPRQPCWKPARRFKIKELALLIQNTGRTGWYFRVLQEGYVEKEQEFTLLARPFPQWTIAACNEVMHEKKDDIQSARELSQCELLAVNWKNTLTKRVQKGEESDLRRRIIGPNE